MQGQTLKKKRKQNKPRQGKKEREKKKSLQPPIPPWKVRDPRSAG